MSRFNNLKLKYKLALLVGIFVVGFIAFAGFSHNTLTTVKVNGPLYQRIVLGKDLIADILPPPEYIIETYLVVLQIEGETDPAKTSAQIERTKTLKADFDTRHEFWVANLPDGTMKDVMVNKAYQPAAEFFSIMQKEFIPAIVAGDRDKARVVSRGLLREKYELHRAAIDEVVRMSTETNQANEASTAEFIQNRTLALTLAVTGILAIGCFLAFVVARGILKPLGQTVQALEAVAEGRLDSTVDYTSKDEIGSLAEASRTVTGTLRRLTSQTTTLIARAQKGDLGARGNTEGLQGVFGELIEGVNSIMHAIESLNAQAGKQRDSAVRFLADASAVLNRIAQRDLTARLDGDVDGDFDGIKHALNTAVENLNETLSQVSVTGVQVAAAARQISAGSQNVAQGASTQASSLEEMAGSIAQVASMTRQNADSAKEARSLTDSALDSARRGMQSMERMSTAISRIKESADATAKIVKTIDEIAFQTNLLALNAAVEAARAGDAGRGFAVVAEEVRNLAMRSAEAAKNTANLIEESARNAEGGVALNSEVVKNLREINDGIGNVGKVMEEVSTSSHQQSQGVEQLNKAMDQINAATQQTAANAEESASAAEELTAQAAEMQTAVSSFHLLHVA